MFESCFVLIACFSLHLLLFAPLLLSHFYLYNRLCVCARRAICASQSLVCVWFVTAVWEFDSLSCPALKRGKIEWTFRCGNENGRQSHNRHLRGGKCASASAIIFFILFISFHLSSFHWSFVFLSELWKLISTWGEGGRRRREGNSLHTPHSSEVRMHLFLLVCMFLCIGNH